MTYRLKTDKISCWIDLAVPHSGEWTEGMTPEDRESYMRVYRKRLDQQEREAANVREYIAHSEKGTNP